MVRRADVRVYAKRNTPIPGVDLDVLEDQIRAVGLDLSLKHRTRRAAYTSHEDRLGTGAGRDHPDGGAAV
jgi:hypothetical protein